MKNNSISIFILGLLFSASACFTPTLRTATIATGSPAVNTSLGFQFATEKDPFVEGAPVDRIPYIFASLLEGFGIEWGTTFFGKSETDLNAERDNEFDRDYDPNDRLGNEKRRVKLEAQRGLEDENIKNGGLACSLGFQLAFLQQDFHPRCGLLQQDKGDAFSLALGYKFSINTAALFLDEADLQFVSGNVATLDLDHWFADRISPILNIEIGRTIIPDRVTVRSSRDRNGNPFSEATSSHVDAWTLKSTLGMGIRWRGRLDALKPDRYEILLGFTPIFRLEAFALRGFETSITFHFK